MRSVGPYQQAFTFSTTCMPSANLEQLSISSKYNSPWDRTAATLWNILAKGVQEFQVHPPTSYDLKQYPASSDELIFIYVFRKYQHTWSRDHPGSSSTIYLLIDHLIKQVIQDYQAQAAENISQVKLRKYLK